MKDSVESGKPGVLEGFVSAMVLGILFVAVVPQLHGPWDVSLAMALGLAGLAAFWRWWSRRDFPSHGWDGLVVRTLAVMGLCWTFLIFLPVGGWLSLPLLLPPAEGNAEAIVTLAAGPDDAGEPSFSCFQRVLHGVKLFRAGRAPRIVFSTGDIELNGHDEKAAIASLAILLTLPTGSFDILKDGITTTRTEAQTVAAFLRGKGIRRILLVTNGPHILRATRTFRSTGLEVLPAPVQTAAGINSFRDDHLGLFQSAMHEWLGLVLYWWRGDLTAGAPKP